MKRLLCVCLALLLVCVLLPGAKAEDAFRFTRENFPKLDGSTSMVPLGNGIASVLLGESREDTAALISFNRTTQSFRNLCSGESDIVIAAEPKNEVFQEMAEAAFPYEMEQIATEALVFVVNENNPVSSLTTEQVRGIYSGEITNWSQVGGEDLPIAAFQRNPTAGSQVMMEKLVMAGTPMMEAPASMIPAEMGALIESVRSYDNSANAIGYTVFYYAADMQMAQGLKILQIDGVTPCAETLRSGEYPFLNGYYACISALADAGSPQRMLYDWLVSEAGQELLTLEGYVSVYAPGEAPAAGDNVFTDYSSYAPNNGTPAKFTSFDCPKDHLEPREDYGDIFPYEGAQLYATWGDDSADYPAGTLFGFYNHQGQLITDPIYTSISHFALDDLGSDYLWVVSDGEERYGYVARDGSYASEICYDSLYRLGDYLFAASDYHAGIFQILDRQLNPIATQEDYTFDGKVFTPFTLQGELTLCQHYDDDWWNSEYLILDKDHNILVQSNDYLYVDSNNIINSYDSDWNVTLYYPDMTPLELPEVGENRCLVQLNDHFYEVTGDAGSYIIDTNGSLFEWDFDSAASSWEGWFTVQKNGSMSLYDSNGRLRYSGLSESWNYLGDGIFAESIDEELVLHKLPEGKQLRISDGSYAYPCGDVYVVYVQDNDSWTCLTVDKELNLLSQNYGDLASLDDPITGQSYLLAYDSYGFTGEQRLLTPDGRTLLFRANGQLGLQNGCITVSNDWAFTCYDPDGSVVFCYPYYGMASGD
ncbi:MAG: PstS family phosphate ABC transporter substrate-binding protein [Faecousia sp.]